MSTTSTNILESEEYLDSIKDDEKINSKNFITFFILGVCNVFLFMMIMEFAIFGEHHEFLFYPAIPFTIIKIFPLFITSFFVKYNFLVYF